MCWIILLRSSPMLNACTKVGGFPLRSLHIKLNEWKQDKKLLPPKLILHCKVDFSTFWHWNIGRSLGTGLFVRYWACKGGGIPLYTNPLCLHSDSSEVFVTRIWHTCTSLIITGCASADSSIRGSYSSISACAQVFKLSRWKKVIVIIFIFRILTDVISSIIYKLYNYHRVPRIHRVMPQVVGVVWTVCERVTSLRRCVTWRVIWE